MHTLVAPVRLRSTEHAHRKVTWLELFFDLIFVAAVAQVAAPLRASYSVAGLIRFAPLFMLIWWAWTGHSVFATRFDTDDGVQRLLTLLQMFAVAVMAANATDALDSRSSAGFAAAYAALRFVLIAQYVRARRVPGARALATRYLAGHGVAALLWLASALVDAPARFWIWGVAFAIDLGTPWTAVSHSIETPPDAAHLPERFGLFTLILLGEAVVAVMQGMESQEEWPAAAALSAFLGMASVFLIWAWYFDGVDAAAERPVRSRRDAWRLHVWSYAHFPLALGIVVTGVGIQRIVTAAARQPLTFSEGLILTGAAALVMVAMTTIGAASTTAARPPAKRAAMHLAIAAGTVACGAAGMVATPARAVSIVAAALAAQLVTCIQRPIVLRRIRRSSSSWRSTLRVPPMSGLKGRTYASGTADAETVGARRNQTGMRIVFIIALSILFGGFANSVHADSRIDVGLLLGSTRATDEAPVLLFDRGTTYQATFGWTFLRVGRASLSLDVPFIASPAFTVINSGPALPLEYASLYLTPGVRVTVRPGRAVSLFGAAGAGYARYTESRLRADRSPNPGQQDTNAGAIGFGGGVDIRGLSWLGFRGEVRDIYTGGRAFSVQTSRRRVHNVVVSGGLVLAF